MIMILRLLINAAALLVLPQIVSGVSVSGWYTALITALILAILNTVIRPIVQILALPISVLTLGIFALVINALFFWFVSSFVDGFSVTGFWPAFWGALVMSIVSWATNALLKSH
ncbi:MAG: phage holin family protein [Parcubacteria group bacterium]|nr:phage holin family protein [Parcubacteria group bacterium]